MNPFQPPKRTLTGEEAFRYQLAKRIDFLVGKLYKGDKAFLIKKKYPPRLYYRFKEPTNNPTFISLCRLTKALEIDLKTLFDFKMKDTIEVTDYYMLSKFLDRKKARKAN